MPGNPRFDYYKYGLPGCIVPAGLTKTTGDRSGNTKAM